MTEETFGHILICTYTVLNRLVDVIRNLILFKKPLRTTLNVLLLLALAGIADKIGDQNVLWLVVAASFVVPWFIVKGRETADGEELVALTAWGQVVKDFLKSLWREIDAKVPKFKDLE